MAAISHGHSGSPEMAEGRLHRKSILFPTEAGLPKAGIISPTLATYDPGRSGTSARGPKLPQGEVGEGPLPVQPRSFWFDMRMTSLSPVLLRELLENEVSSFGGAVLSGARINPLPGKDLSPISTKGSISSDKTSRNYGRQALAKPSQEEHARVLGESPRIIDANKSDSPE